MRWRAPSLPPSCAAPQAETELLVRSQQAQLAQAQARAERAEQLQSQLQAQAAELLEARSQVCQWCQQRGIALGALGRTRTGRLALPLTHALPRR